jgi:hypothetical protein
MPRMGVSDDMPVVEALELSRRQSANRPKRAEEPRTYQYRGRDGHGIGLGFWLSLPLWVALGLIAILFAS